ncbi:MAG TPA: nicotinate-nucleotide--dimethylbenzimidazole phosphoribosyltransferase [Ktedonobacteraceae bacterium]
MHIWQQKEGASLNQPLDIQHIRDLATQIEPLDNTIMEQARMRQEVLTKPAGSLGRLEALAIQIAGITRQVTPVIERKVVIVMAGDHGVTAEGVSAYPSAVTAQMVHNFLHGGAAINALARQAKAKVVIVDVGVATELHSPDLVERKVAYGTANMAIGPAMTQEQMLEAISAGIDTLEAQVQQGVELVATGEMGIGNTTAASAITAAILQLPVERVTGRGTGLDDEQLAHKVRVIERALATNAPDAHNPLDVLTKVGGLEIAGLVGVLLAAGAKRIPVVIDGFITGAAALVATELSPHLANYLIAGHTSVEQGHGHILKHLGLHPLLNLELRLGEGTGATLAMGIIEGALCTHREMLTFAEAGVSERTDE